MAIRPNATSRIAQIAIDSEVEPVVGSRGVGAPDSTGGWVVGGSTATTVVVVAGPVVVVVVGADVVVEAGTVVDVVAGTVSGTVSSGSVSETVSTDADLFTDVERVELCAATVASPPEPSAVNALSTNITAENTAPVRAMLRVTRRDLGVR